MPTKCTRFNTDHATIQNVVDRPSSISLKHVVIIFPSIRQTRENSFKFDVFSELPFCHITSIR